MGSRIVVQWATSERQCRSSSESALDQCASHFVRVSSTPRTLIELRSELVFVWMIRVDIRCHSIQLAIAGSLCVEHGAMKPPLEDKYATEICAMLVAVSENISSRRWRTQRRSCNSENMNVEATGSLQSLLCGRSHTLSWLTLIDMVADSLLHEGFHRDNTSMSLVLSTRALRMSGLDAETICMIRVKL